MLLLISPIGKKLPNRMTGLIRALAPYLYVQQYLASTTLQGR
jgi:hypothetical protein